MCISVRAHVMFRADCCIWALARIRMVTIVCIGQDRVVTKDCGYGYEIRCGNYNSACPRLWNEICNEYNSVYILLCNVLLDRFFNHDDNFYETTAQKCVCTLIVHEPHTRIHMHTHPHAHTYTLLNQISLRWLVFLLTSVYLSKHCFLHTWWSTPHS
jgi:hypothetical protein